jgi:hypothetical protein
MALIFPSHSNFRAKYPIIVKNGASEEIPPGAVMAISSVQDRDGQAVVTVIKPTSTFARQYLVNSPIAIANNSSAEGYAGFLEDGGYVYYNSGSPAMGEEWGVTSGQWYLTQNRPGFVVTNETTSFNSKNLVWAKGHLTTQVLGVLASGTLAVNNSGSFNIYGGTPGSEASIGLTQSAYYKTGPDTLTTSDFVVIGWLHGKAYASPFVCS